MIILQLPQGSHDVTGLTIDEARGRLEQWDAEFLEKFPQCRPFHRPSWMVLGVTKGRVPWGHEWYAVGADGRLYLHSADYDSSG